MVRLSTLLLAALALPQSSFAADRHSAAPRLTRGRRGSAPETSRPLLAATTPKPVGSSVTMTVVQIVNNVAGAGILTLAAGMAAGVGWVPAIAICVALGAISGYTFYLIGASCELTGTSNFKGLWGATLGPRSAWIVDGCIALMCLSAAIIYSGILGDVFSSLLRLAGVPASGWLRQAVIASLTAAVLCPLSLLKDLSALSFTSAIGCVAILYTAAFVAVRALDGAYTAPSELLASLAPERAPSFVLSSLTRLDSNALVLVSNLGLAFIAHYNAPAFYMDLEARSPAKFARAVAIAFGVLTVLYTAMMGFGYATFGDHAASNLLLNYASSDPLAIVGRLATGASILFGYPLAMVGLRSALVGMSSSLSAEPALPAAARRAFRSLAADASRVPLIVALLAVITAVACAVEDIGVVVGVSGALLGAAIVYCFPPLIYGRARGASTPQAVYCLIPLGAFLGVLGTYVTLRG